MKPYYEDTKSGITIYNADCRDILPSLPKVDLVLTDPPYGINFQSNVRVVTPKFDLLKNDDSAIFDIDWMGLINPKVIALFTRWDVLHCWKEVIEKRIPIRGCVVWHKSGGGGGLGDLKRSYAPDYELILYASKDEWGIPGKRHGSVWFDTRESVNHYEHPTQKPVGIMNMCIDRFSISDDLIIDPFAGSGTTLRAAKDLGRKAIGIEIEEKYCEIAAKRLSQEVFDFNS